MTDWRCHRGRRESLDDVDSAERGQLPGKPLEERRWVRPNGLFSRRVSARHRFFRFERCVDMVHMGRQSSTWRKPLRSLTSAQSLKATCRAVMAGRPVPIASAKTPTTANEPRFLGFLKNRRNAFGSVQK